MELSEYEKIQPSVELDGMKFFVPNTHCLWRIETLYTKEKDTIAWLSAMSPDDTLFDIGANIGQYTIFAAKRGLKVFAFEPESQNFALLQRNIVLNSLENATAWPLCIDTGTKISVLHLSGLLPGGSCHAFDKNLNFAGETRDFPHRQGSISVAMDELIDLCGLPDHIKIDVDGFEHRVCGGAHRCLTHAKSVLVEINSHYPEHVDLVARLQKDYGFKVDQAQVDAARRTEGTFEGVGNVILFKGDSWK